MAGVFILIYSFLNTDFLILRNCKQWLDYRKFCAYSFMKDVSEDLDTISLIDVYERLIHVAIQHQKSLNICIVKLTFRDKHEPRSI